MLHKMNEESTEEKEMRKERIEELEILIQNLREKNQYLSYHDITQEDQVKMSDLQDELEEQREAL